AGIALYGASPFTGRLGTHFDLKPVMTLNSELIAIQTCQAGDCVGYGGTWVCPEMMNVGVVAVGYGDGYPFHAPQGTPVLLNGDLVPLIGRVSMDMLTIDLRQQPRAKIGDSVVVWGNGLPVETVAAHAKTIPYELLCAVSRRVHRRFK